MSLKAESIRVSCAEAFSKMVFQSVCLVFPNYRRDQIVLAIVLLCEDNSLMIPSRIGIGTIGYKRFQLIMARQMREEEKGTYEEALAEIFRLFDRHADGFIDCSELHIAIMAAGEHVTEEEVHELIREWDKNSDGKLDFDEWTKLLENVQ
ncbi:troponin C, skeletal muscle-like [Stegostoma tigrinum]|uniref:troponin C, skeletal muscle-like n=1 Tax=Stegostoma tigrinum TaxID=3053191 RepID=UPI00287042C7|nr:troponin C, skeletal muscle-like [Stegostoma tigrinum]